MSLVTKILYVISTGLLIPVVIGLLLLFGWALVELGGCFREYLSRRKGLSHLRKTIQEMQDALNASRAITFEVLFGKESFHGFVGSFVRQSRAAPQSALAVGKVIDDIETAMLGRLSQMAFGSRLGPILGLMGTLIPMGPALTGLASGNIETMAKNLVVAFSTTVLGLAVGGLCYGMSLARRKWYAQDLSDIEFIYEALFSEGGEQSNVSS